MANVQERKKRLKKAHRPLMFIEHEKERKRTFKDREQTLRKMAKELSDIDQVQSCFICYGEDGVTSWPENHQQMEAIIKTYKDHDMNNVSRKYNLSSYLAEKMEKNREKVKSLENDLSREMSNTWDKQIERIPDEAVGDMLNLVDSKLKIAMRVRSTMLSEKMHKTIQNNNNNNNNNINNNLFTSQSLQKVPSMLLPEWTMYGQNASMTTSGSNIGRIPEWQKYSETSGINFLQDFGNNNFPRTSNKLLPFEGLIQHNDMFNQPIPISNNSLHATGHGQNVNNNGLLSCNPFRNSSNDKRIFVNGFHDNNTDIGPGQSAFNFPLTGTGFGHNFMSNGLFSCTSFNEIGCPYGDASYGSGSYGSTNFGIINNPNGTIVPPIMYNNGQESVVDNNKDINFSTSGAIAAICNQNGLNSSQNFYQ